MIRQFTACCVLSLSILVQEHAWSKDVLPIEPDLSTRIDELYDHEARLFHHAVFVKGNGRIDYITGRWFRSTQEAIWQPCVPNGNQPLFYWWNHTMWNDPEQDGVNGNERIYQEDIEFDISRYKPCPSTDSPVSRLLPSRFERPIVS